MNPEDQALLEQAQQIMTPQVAQMDPRWQWTLDQMYRPEPWAYDPRRYPAQREPEAVAARGRDAQAFRGMIDLQGKMEGIVGQQHTRQHQVNQLIEQMRHNRAMEQQAKTNAGSRDPYEKIQGPQGEWYNVPKDPRGGLRTIPIAGPDGQQLTQTQPLTATELEALRDNSQQMFEAARALRLMRGERVDGQQGDPTATGWEGYVPGMAQLLPGVVWAMGGQEGVATRGAVGNIGSLRIKNRSGGAVPAAEMGRLKPFVPAEGDPEEVVRTKLEGFVREYAKMLEEDVGFYRAGQRRVPVALENMVKQSIGVGQKALNRGGESGDDAAYRRALLEAIRAAAANRR